MPIKVMELKKQTTFIIRKRIDNNYIIERNEKAFAAYMKPKSNIEVIKMLVEQSTPFIKVLEIKVENEKEVFLNVLDTYTGEKVNGRILKNRKGYNGSLQLERKSDLTGKLIYQHYCSLIYKPNNWLHLKA